MIQFNNKTGEFVKKSTKETIIDTISVILKTIAILLSDAAVFHLYSYEEFGLIRGILYALFWPLAIPIDFIY